MRLDLPRLRLAAVIATAALALHELRYLIGFGDHAGEALAARGHSYLPLAGGVAGLLLALACAQLLLALDRARRTSHGELPPGFLRLWPALTLVLLVVYGGQELIEAALSPTHAAGADALLAGGGWTALPLAAALAAAAALLLRQAGRAVALAARRRWRPGRARPRPTRPWTAPPRVTRSPLALHLAGRAPPPPPRSA
jgi:hypothetical protein